MSVYREPARRRARAAVLSGVAGLLVGGLAGFLVARASEDDPSLPEQVSALQDRIGPALNALELVTIEYPEAVRGGEVVAETEYRAAVSQAGTAATALMEERASLEAISPQETIRAERLLDELQQLIEERADPADVERVADTADGALRAAAGVEP